MLYRRNWIFSKIIGRVKNIISIQIKDVPLAHYIDSRKGLGNYEWKFIALQRALKSLEVGNVLLYTDCGVVPLKNLNVWCDMLFSNTKKDIIAFETGYLEKECSARWFLSKYKVDPNSAQLMSGIFLIRKSLKSEEIINKVVELNTLENLTGIINSPSDIAKVHRHDQSIWSMVSKRNPEYFQVLRDPTEYGKWPSLYYFRNDFTRAAMSKPKSEWVFILPRRDNLFIYLLKLPLKLLSQR